jgi:hypothetical protein
MFEGAWFQASAAKQLRTPLFWVIMQRVVAFRSWMLADICYLFELACPTSENVTGALSTRWIKKRELSIVFDRMYLSFILRNLNIIRRKNRVKASNSTWKLTNKTVLYVRKYWMWFEFWVLVEWHGELRILLGGVWFERHILAGKHHAKNRHVKEINFTSK